MAIGRATLDFFASQRAARRRSAFLLVLFTLALALVVAIVYLALLAPAVVLSMVPPRLWNGSLLLGSAAGVIAVCGTGTAYHVVSLGRGGGEAVARMMGGEAVDRQTSRDDERRLLNVVEEMAIASGMPVPRAFVLRAEPGINAFAAGLSPADAVLAVTRGCLEQLSRDELQGVVAHEFSHILNADVKLNLRLLGAVGGLGVVSIVGRGLLDGALRGRTDRDEAQARGAAFAVGFLLTLAGWVGVACGQLVRFAVSREREYLADAAAVQFTRNPAGLAGALRKIARHGSMLTSGRALEASHYFFANAVSGVLERWFATHPPLEERIRRLEPQGAPAGETARAPAAEAPRAEARPSDLVARIGAPAQEQLARAGEILAQLPAEITAAAREPFGARCLVCALVLAPDDEGREAQLARVALDEPVLAEVRNVVPAVVAAGREHRIAILDLALPSLDGLSAAQVGALRSDLRRLAEADGRVTVFEWAVQRAVVRRLERRLSPSVSPARYRTLEQVEVECLELLCLLAWAGARGAEEAQAALDAGVRELAARERWRLLARAKVRGSTADRALAALDQATPELKRSVLRACAATALADSRLTDDEAGLLRAVSSSLGCPMPPVITDVAPAPSAAPRVPAAPAAPAGSPARRR